jgi:hypothetical protein
LSVTQSSTWVARILNSAGSAMKCGRLGRVSATEPACASRIGSNGGTGPLAAPNSTSVPRVRRLARLASKVDAPTPS